MIKEERIPVTMEKIHMKYYCDKCGEFIDEYKYFEDGYFPSSKGNIKLRVNVNGWFTYRGCLCDKCTDKKIEEIQEALKKLGFTKD